MAATNRIDKRFLGGKLSINLVENIEYINILKNAVLLIDGVFPI
jgi:hypothetical protein